MKLLPFPGGHCNVNLRFVEPFLLGVSSPASAADTSATHMARGDALMAKNDLDGAIREYRQALRLRPRNAKAHYEIGLALKIKGDLDGSISEYRQAIRIDPTLAEA